MSPVEVVIWVLVGGGVIGIAIVALGALLLGIEAAMALWERFKR